MKHLYGSLEQLIASLRKCCGGFCFNSLEMPLAIIPESATPDMIKMKISKVVCEKLEADETAYSVSLHYVSANSRLLAMCSGTCKRNELCNWVEEKMDKSVASFAIIVKHGKHINSDAKIYLFTTTY